MINRSKNRTSFLLLIFSFLSGCVSLNATIPIQTAETPESIGVEEKRASLLIASNPSHEFTLSPDASNRPPTLDKPSVASGSQIMASASYGLLNNLDVGISTGRGNMPWLLKLKLQVIGEKKSQAKKGNHSAAIGLGAGLGSSRDSGDQNGVLGPGGHNWEAKVNSRVGQVLLAAGTRLTDQLLLSSTFSVADWSVKGEIDHKVSDDGLSPSAQYSKSYQGNQRSATLGLRYETQDQISFFGAEAQYSELRMNDAPADFQRRIGLFFGAFL